MTSLKFANPVKFANQQVARTSLGQLLASDEYKQIVIPVFQRPYCWPESQLEAWVENVVEGGELLTTDHCNVEDMFEVIAIEEFHSVGIGRFKRIKSDLTCVDGQQRITTTSLFIAAIADILHDLSQKEANEEEEFLRQVIKKCEYFLFNSRDNREDFSCLRVLPSHQDREHFYNCVVGNRSSRENVHQEDSSQIVKTKKYFLSSLQRILSDSGEHKSQVLLKLLRSCVTWMRMMVVTVDDEVDLCSWFLWLQEKSLLGFAALLMNNAPGVDFRAGDLVKNLLLSAFIEQSVASQDELYSRLWTPELQRCIHNDKFIERYLEDNKNLVDNFDSKSPYEIHLLRYGSEDNERLSGLRLYGRFSSFYEKYVEKRKDEDLENVHIDLLNSFIALTFDFE